MTRLSPPEVERRLTRGEVPPPPADLAERIKAEIPEPAAAPGPPRQGRVPSASWLIAASLAVAVLGGLLAWRVERELAPPRPVRALDAPAPRPGEAPPLGDVRVAAPPLPPEAEPVAAPSAPPPATAAPGAPTAVAAGESPPVRVRPTPAPPERGEDLAAGGRIRREEAKVERDLRQDAEDLPQTAEEPVPTEPRPSPEATFAGPPVVGVPSTAAQEQAASGTAGALTVGEAPVREKRRRLAPPPSTGGTAEPNDRPYGDMFFRGYGVNPFVDTEDDPLSTFGLDVDTGSYTIARRYIREGHLPPPEAIRVEEFINYPDYGDPLPGRDDFAVSAQAGPAPFASSERARLLRFHLRARAIDPEARRPATLVFVVDVSGSMDRGDRLGLVKRSLHLLLDRLRPDDRVGLVVYGSRGRIVLEPTGNLEAIRHAVERLRPGGSTNAEEGLLLGYYLIGRYFRPDGIHRIILCSDGVANVGRTGAESILDRVEREAEGGVELSTVGFGMGNYNDVLMEQLADRGDGSYAYVDRLSEARRIIVQNLEGTLQTVASEARVQVEFDPRVVSRYRLLGYENRDIADHRFRDDSVDAGEIGSGHGVTALYEIKLAERPRRSAPLATLRLRYRSVEEGRFREISLRVRQSEVARTWERAAPELRLTAVVAELAEILKGTYWAREGDLRELERMARRVLRDFPENESAADVVRLIGEAARLSERSVQPPVRE